LFSVNLLGFVAFVVNLLNSPTDGATVSVRKSVYKKVRPKKSYFSSPWEYVKLLFSLKVPKKMQMQNEMNHVSNSTEEFVVVGFLFELIFRCSTLASLSDKIFTDHSHIESNNIYYPHII
jgi:hypothetical protein